MKKLILFIMITMCTHIVAKDLQNDILDISFDKKPWVFGHVLKSDSGSITQYLLQGENTSNWSEQVAVEKSNSYSWGNNISSALVDFYDKYILSIKSASNRRVKSRIIDRNDKELVFEWFMPPQKYSKNDPRDVEYGVVKAIIVSSQVTYIYTYMKKKATSFKNIQDTWIPIAKKVSIQKKLPVELPQPVVVKKIVIEPPKKEEKVEQAIEIKAIEISEKSEAPQITKQEESIDLEKILKEKKEAEIAKEAAEQEKLELQKFLETLEKEKSVIGQAQNKIKNEQLLLQQELAKVAEEKAAVQKALEDSRKEKVAAQQALAASVREKAVAQQALTASAREKAIAQQALAASAREKTVAQQVLAASTREKTAAQQALAASVKAKAVAQQTLTASTREKTVALQTLEQVKKEKASVQQARTVMQNEQTKPKVTEAKNVEVTEEKIFRNKELCCSFALPSNWTEEKQESQQNNLVYKYSAKDSDIAIFVKKKNVPRASLYFQNEVKDDVLENKTPEYGVFRNADYIRLLSGKQATIYIFNKIDPKTQESKMLILHPKSLVHQYYEISVIVKPELYYSYYEVIQKAFSSFIMYIDSSSLLK